MSKHALQGLELADLNELVRPMLVAAYGRWESSAGTAFGPADWYCLLIGAAQQEVATPDEIVALSAFAFVPQVTEFTAEAREALGAEGVRAVLRRCRESLTAEALMTPEAASQFYQGLRHHFRDQAGLRGKQVMLPIRAALTGTLVGPCLGIVSALLGWERCMRRLEDLLA
jgi:nondiscriminating glutamyl-tRNA synthetase